MLDILSHILDMHPKDTFDEVFTCIVTSPEVPIINKFFSFSDIPNNVYASFKDKLFRKKDDLLSTLISFCLL